jgi:hypothetical protein
VIALKLFLDLSPGTAQALSRSHRRAALPELWRTRPHKEERCEWASSPPSDASRDALFCFIHIRRRVRLVSGNNIDLFAARLIRDALVRYKLVSKRAVNGDFTLFRDLYRKTRA